MMITWMKLTYTIIIENNILNIKKNIFEKLYKNVRSISVWLGLKNTKPQEIIGFRYIFGPDCYDYWSGWVF